MAYLRDLIGNELMSPKPEITYEWIDANRWYKPRAPKGWYVVPETIRSSMDEETGGGFIKYLMKRVD